MRKTKGMIWKRGGAWLLVLAMLLGFLPGNVLTAKAADAAANGTLEKVADPGTVNSWQQVFANDTSYAGGVWTDKSVFTGYTAEDGDYVSGAEAYTDATSETENAVAETALALQDENNFLVALSAIASTKTIVGYDSIPTDTIFVLDMSSSMYRANAIDDLANATDDAIETLLGVNNHNRVGVVLYSGSGHSEILLDLDRYSTTANGSSKYLQPYSNNSGIRVVSGVTGDKSKNVGGRTASYHSGTFTQDGIYLAMKQLEAADKTIESGIQAGVERIPIIVLMTDGAPTILAKDFTGNLGASGNLSASTGVAEGTNRDFMTQVSGAYAKYRLEEGPDRYPTNDLLFYTLGMGSISNFPALWPQGSDETDGFWTDFLSGDRRASLADNLNVDATSNDPYVDGFMDALEADKSRTNQYRAYVDQYFPASNAAGLSAAFQSIVDEIILQSMYYPTLTDGNIHGDGYVEFHDYIGANMEVKAIKGIQLGEDLFTGENFAEQLISGSGSVEDPSDMGDNIVWAVRDRLKLEDKTEQTAVEQARDIIDQAYRYGQLSYDVRTGAFSNYIGWYSDADGKYLASWDGGDTDQAPDNAAYAVKSYFFLDAVGAGHRQTDTLYAMVQVRTHLDTGVQEVHGKLPASLIPLVQYTITLNGSDPTKVQSVEKEGATFPSRLVYEVGLSSEIDLLDIVNTAPDQEALLRAVDDTTDKNGEFVRGGNKDGNQYVFYTNDWQRDAHEDEDHPLPDLNKYNTHVFFEPSYENERYYYHEDMPIYVASGSGYSLYTGAAKPAADQNGENTTYYRLRYIYEVGSTNVRMTYELIPGKALADAKVKQTASGWAVEMGTIHRYDARAAVTKTSNPTDTLDHSEHAMVHDDSQYPYHIDAILGNNGKLTLTPYQGVKITKALTGELTYTGPYTFNVAVEPKLTEATLIKEVDGVRTESTLTFTNGVAEFELNVGEIAWVVDIPTGTEVKVTENDKVGNDFEVSTINGENKTEFETTIAAGTIVGAAFVNSEETKGQVTISKDVVSDIATHKTDKEFEFQIQISGNAIEANDTFTAVKQDGSTVTLTVVEIDNSLYLKSNNGNINLKHLEAITIQGLPDGTTITATEIDVPNDGFTADDDELSATVQKGDSAVLTFVNTYEAAPTDAPTNIVIGGTKNLETNEDGWSGTFNFELQKLVNGSWVKVVSEAQNGTNYYVSDAEASVTYENGKGVLSFDHNKQTDVGMSLAGEVYTAPGTYSYRIVELHGASDTGISYDSKNCYFDVVVIDDGSGKLKINEVKNYADTEVHFDDSKNEWTVSASFKNKYTVGGSAEAIIGIKKMIESDHGVLIDPTGFRFALYPADSTYTEDPQAEAIISEATSSAGLANIGLTFPETDTYYYVLKEVAGSVQTGNGTISYDDTEYFVKVVVGHDNGEYTVVLTVYGDKNEDIIIVSDANPADAAIEKAAAPVFEIVTVTEGEGENASINRYVKISSSTASADIFYTIEGETSEVLYTDDTQIVATEGLKLSAVAKADGLKDSDPVSYQVTAEGTIEMLDAGTPTAQSTEVVVAQVEGVTFTNKYTPNHTELAVAVTGSKVLNGRAMNAQDEFWVDVYEADADFNVKDSNNVITSQKIDWETGSFTLPKRQYTTTGNYYFVIRERVPEGAVMVDGKYVLNGVTYDPTVYNMTIQVTGDNSTGKLTAQVTSVVATGHTTGTVDRMVFTNTYKATPAQATIEGTKTLTGRGLQAGMFTFELVENGKVIQTVTNGTPNGNTASFIFKLDYDEAGNEPYTYIIREKLPEGATAANQYTVDGVTYSNAQYEVTVTVTDDGMGQLNASVSYGEQSVVFNNSYSAAPVTVADISGTKTLTGDDLAKHTFTFELWEAKKEAGGTGNVYAVGDAPLATVNNNGSSFTFPGRTFTSVGDYWFIIKETAGSVDGMHYDTTLHYVEVNVRDDLRGQLIAEVKINGSANGTIAFINDRDPDPVELDPSTSVYLSGTKVLSGKTLAAGQFTFELYTADQNGNATDEEPLLVATNTASGRFVFRQTENDELTYTQAGTYYYVIKEQLPMGDDGNPVVTKDGITYDQTSYAIRVNVTENVVDGRATLIPTISVLQGGDWVPVDQTPGNSVSDMGVKVEFENVYSTTTSNQVDLPITKTLNGKELPEGVVYSFELYENVTVSGSTVNYDHTQASQTTTSAVGGFTFTYNDDGTYYYIVKETIPAGAVFNNTLGKWVLDGVCYDPAVYLVKVVVVDNGNGTLTAHTPIFYKVNPVDHSFAATTQSLVFANETTLNVPGPGVEFNGEKVLENKNLVAGEFSFALYLANVEGENWTKTNDAPLTSHSDAEGKFFFNNVGQDGHPISKDFVVNQAGTYYYIMEEQIPDGVDEANKKDGITYDASKFGVTVVVRQLPTGKLEVASIAYTDLNTKTVIENDVPEFKNSFDTVADQVKIEATKTLNSETVADAIKYAFNLYNANVDADGKVTWTNEGVKTVSNQGSYINFGTFTYDDDIAVNATVSHYYVVEEAIPAGATAENQYTVDGVTYDTTKYLVKVDVTNTAEGNGNLKASVPVAYVLEEENGVYTYDATASSSLTFNNATKLDIPEDPEDPDGSPYDIALGGTKVLQGRKLGADDKFTFRLYRADAEWNIVNEESYLTATSGADGKFDFVNTDPANADFVVSEPGHYHFVMKEVAGEDAKITYDAGVVHVGVDVNYVLDDNGESTGALKVTNVSYAKVSAEGETAVVENAQFINIYKPDAIENDLVISGYKTYNGQAPDEDLKFTFEVYENVNVSKNGTVSYAGITPTTVVNDREEIQFFSGKLDEEKVWHFLVKEQIPAEAKNGVIVDGAMTVTYDTTEYLVSVDVRNNIETGRLYVANVSYNKVVNNKIVTGADEINAIAFANTAKIDVPELPEDPDPGVTEVLPVVRAKKTLMNKSLVAGQFTFELYVADAQWNINAAKKLTATNDADGLVTFENDDTENFVITAPGIYYYVMKERDDKADNISYDGSVYLITLEVGYADNTPGALVVENYRYEKAKEDDPETVNEITFANVYTPDPVSVSITGNKIFKDHDGKELKVNADQFQFALYETTASYETEGVIPTTVHNDGDGKFQFALNLTDTTSKHYVVKEVKGSDTEINYSQEVYYVTVNVANNNGTLVPTVVVKNAQDETVDSDKLTFTNTKEAPKIPDPITVTLNVEKKLKNLGGGKLDLRNFMVELVDASDESVEGTKRFDSKTGKTYFTIRFTNAHAGGTYKYILREVDTDVDGVVYSTKEYEIKITVTANNGELTAQVWVDGKKVTDVNKLTFEFTNIYRDPGDPYVPKDPTKPSSPDTGDEGSGLWLIMLVLSSFGFVMTAFGALRRRRRAR